MKVKTNVNMEMKDIINAGSSTQVVKDFKDKEFVVTGFLIATKEVADKETGEIKNTEIAVLKGKDGLVSSISHTVIESVQNIVDAYTDADKLDEISKGIKIKICSNKSSKGREFFYLDIV